MNQRNKSQICFETAGTGLPGVGSTHPNLDFYPRPLPSIRGWRRVIAKLGPRSGQTLSALASNKRGKYPCRTYVSVYCDQCIWPVPWARPPKQIGPQPIANTIRLSTD